MITILGLLAVSESTQKPSDSDAASRIDQPRKVVVTPGDTEVERGTSLVITARFEGIDGDAVPDEAELLCTAADGSERRIGMAQNLDDPVLGGFVPSIDQAFRYRIVTPDWQSQDFDVDVFEYPSLVRSDAHLKYPDYTAMGEKRVEDTVRVSAVEGTEVTWICFLNKPVATAELVSADGTTVALQPDADTPGPTPPRLNSDKLGGSRCI